MSEKRKQLTSKERIVVKIGTSSLSFQNGKTNYTRLEKLAMVLSDLMSCGKEIILVTSGAIGVGAGRLKMDDPPKASLKPWSSLERISLYRITFPPAELFRRISDDHQLTTNCAARRNR